MLPQPDQSGYRRRLLVAALLAACALLASGRLSAAIEWQLPQPQPECLPNVIDDASAIRARLAAVQANPNAFLPKLELARCFDLTWQLEHVERAVDQATTALEAELSGPPPGVPGLIPLAGVDVPSPQRLEARPPDYPSAALAGGVTGLVIVEATVDTQGRVRDARIARSIAELDTAAITAIRNWRFAPTAASGKPTELRMYLPVKFGQTNGQWASDYLEIAAFFNAQGLRPLTRGALLSARNTARADAARYGRVHELKTLRGMTGLVLPAPVKSPAPRYTAQAMREKVQGDVELRILVDRSGGVGRAIVVRPLPYLNIVAQQSALQWQFSPAIVNGEPASVIAQLVLTFRLK